MKIWEQSLKKQVQVMKKQLRQYASLLTWETLEHLMKYMENIFTEKPARSCVAVKELPKNVLCEVEVIAEI